jgi:hypothetical protein
MTAFCPRRLSSSPPDEEVFVLTQLLSVVASFSPPYPQIAETLGQIEPHASRHASIQQHIASLDDRLYHRLLSRRTSLTTPEAGCPAGRGGATPGGLLSACLARRNAPAIAFEPA